MYKPGNTWQYMVIHGDTWQYMLRKPGNTWVYLHGKTWAVKVLYGLHNYNDYIKVMKMYDISKIQLLVYYQCCIDWLSYYYTICYDSLVVKSACHICNVLAGKRD